MSQPTEPFDAWASSLGHSLPGEVVEQYAGNARAELAPWRERGITSGDLERLLPDAPDVHRYQVIGGVLHRVTTDRFGREWIERGRREFETWVGRLFRRAGCPCPDLDFVVNIGDFPQIGFPVFSTWVRRDDLNLRMPSSAHWDIDASGPDDGSTVRCHRLFDGDALARPFAERESRVVWRGSATGVWDHDVRRARIKSWLGLPWGAAIPRLALVRLAQRHPDVLDAALTGFTHLTPRSTAFISRRLRTEEWVDRSWFLRYRYIINVDGNVGTWSFLTLLGAGSVLLRQETPYEEFCAPQLRAARPWIPVARDLSDLVERARDCLARGDAMRALADDARDFSRRWLSGRAVDYYFARLMAEYARSWRGPVMRDPAAVPVEATS